MAAAIQASMGNVAAGSFFSMLQSMGALGTGFLGAAFVPIVIVGGTTGIIYIIYKRK